MKTKKFLSFALVLAMLVGMLPGMSLTAGATGSATEITPTNTSGTMTITLTITGTLSDSNVTLSADSFTYNGSTQKPTVTVKHQRGSGAEVTLTEGTDYTVAIKDSANTAITEPKTVGTYTVTVTGTGVYSGTGSKTYSITKSTPSAPAAPTEASASKNTVTLTVPNDGYEYQFKCGNGSWQDSAEFTGLSPNTEYTFYQRIKATGNTNESDSSTGATISTTAKDAQTITAENVTATYGDTNAKVSATSSGAISYAVKDGSGDYIDVAADGKLTIKKAGTATVTVTAAETADYAAAAKDVTVTINKKTLTIKAKDQSIYVGGTVPTLGADSYTVTGLVGSDTLATNPTLAYSSTPDNTKAGSYTITPSGATASDNYTITYQNGTLTISVRSTPSSSSSHDRDDSSDSSSSTPSSATTTTTTTDTTSNPDASTTNGTATVTTTKNNDGSTTAKTTETATKSGGDGSKTEVKAEATTTTKSNTDGTTTAATTAATTATTTAADGTKTVTETKTEAKETLNKSGNGTVEAKTTETVKDASGKVTATTVTESKGTVETATDGTKTTTTTNTAVTTDAAGNKTTVVTTEKATETVDGSTGKVVSDESGKVVSVEAKISESAAESAAKSGETVTLPVTVTAAQSAEDATAVAITVPKAAESVKVEIPVEDVKPGTVAVIVREDGTEEIVKTSTTGTGGVVLTLDGGASVKVVDNTKTFDDVDGSEWYADNVAWASSREVMNGVGNNTFAPNEDTNRAMVTQILYNLDDGKASGAVTSFNDVSAGDWYADSVSWAVENGIAQGEGESFGANDPVSREQLSVMLYNYAGKKGYDVTVKGDISRFADNDSASAWASDALAWAVGVGIINGARDAAGNTLLDPQGNASRAQVTAMTERFCQKAAK